ncbi:MAG TPA: MFS transporter [Blastocatellia bacterium]|nr:MFS transporter [Blastocatellia bacterium]
MTASKTQKAETGNHTSSPPRAGIVIAILFLIFFLGSSDNQMISPLLPLIADEFGMKEGEVGQVIGPAYALAAAMAALLIGPVSDKYGRRTFLLYASVVFGLSLAAIGLIADLRVLAGVRLLTGLAAGTFSTCSIAYVADYFPYKRRGVAMSIVQAGQFLALAFGVQLANNIAQWKGWRTSFVFFGLLSMGAFLAVFAMLPEDKHTMANRDPSEIVARRFHNIRMLFDNRERIASIVAAFFVSGGFVGFFFYLGSWLKQALSFSTHEFDIAFLAIGIALLIGVVVAGPVSDRVGKRGVSILSTVVLAAMLLIIPSLGRGVLLFVSLMAAALAFAFRQGPLQALATELVPRRSRGTLVAARNTASQVGIAIATLVCGQLYDRLGYSAVGLFSGIVTLGAAVCIFIMKEPVATEPAK